MKGKLGDGAIRKNGDEDAELDSPLLTIRAPSPFCVFAFCERRNVTRM